MLTRHHIVLLTIVALSPLVYATSAGAQDQGKRPETTGSAIGLPSGVPPAPVGHRQPRASDMPADAQPTGQEETQIQRDHELDKKLWICRGCDAPP
jgi:hypothetical protein